MAQGTVAKRFLTNSAKTASAGAILVLAVVALLTGCGGGSDGSSTSTAAGGPTADAEPPAGKVGAGPGGTSSGPSEASPGAGAAGGKDSSGTAAGDAAPGQSPKGSSSTGRHGPPVPQPTGEPAPKITPQQRREASVANISLRTTSAPPSSSAGPQVLPAEFTCDGKNTSPALQWRGVPDGTAELVLFAMNLRPVNGTLFFDWAVAGISPDLEALEAGRLPKGAVPGRNSFGKRGYGICPPQGEEETYMFTLFALPEKLSPAPGFDPVSLRKEVLDTSGNVGLLALSYLRR